MNRITLTLIDRGWISAVKPLTVKEKRARKRLAQEPDWTSLDLGHEITSVGFPARPVRANGMVTRTLYGIEPIC